MDQSPLFDQFYGLSDGSLLASIFFLAGGLESRFDSAVCLVTFAVIISFFESDEDDFCLQQVSREDASDLRPKAS
jgi:hypothetical protein